MMRKTAFFVLLLVGLLALTGCSGDNESKMLKYDLTIKVKDVDGNPVAGVNVKIEGETVNQEKTANDNGVVQFNDLVSDTYTVTADAGIKSGTMYKTNENVAIQGADVTASMQLQAIEKLWLYHSEEGSQFNVIDWSSATDLSETSDGDYNNVFKVVSADKWGIGILAFDGLSSTYQSDYKSVTFKVKSDELDEIKVKIPEVESTYNIEEDGTDLGNGWYELTVPFSDFTGTVSNPEAIGFIGGTESGQTFYITDVYFNPQD